MRGITEKKIRIEGTDALSLIGLQDANLEIIERRFDATIVVRGDTITLKGTQEEVDQLERIFKELLFLLKKKGHSHGYELAAELSAHALTDAEVEVAALYRTLRQLETNGCVTSSWDVSGNGPARRVYALTRRGEEHLFEWIVVLEHMTESMSSLTSKARALLRAGKTGARLRPASAAPNPAREKHAPRLVPDDTEMTANALDTRSLPAIQPGPCFRISL